MKLAGLSLLLVGNFSKITFQTYKKLSNFAISINMMVLVDTSFVLQTLQEEEWISQQDRKIQASVMI